ncbi:predicted protein [Nematostella vectensis]|uniref:DDE Tnp4 domain-containing protein n=1 Tax=Nematostella vectensis TaxID=45351 RepID=A7T0I6_NEMVE|nr:predicted protein [Nematostella vectensis]|eukprot:XP_001622629.1 hypothetical protein NEMVEDRAFT_v1g220449 [Nematostella vectensis]
MALQEIRLVLLSMVAILLLFVSLNPPLDDVVPLQQRILPGFHGHQYDGRDVFSLISGQFWLFWRNTGETPLSFIQLVTDSSPVLGRVNVHRDARIRQRRQKINLINQILLALMWLRKYLHFDNLALWFDIDPASVVRIIYKVVPELWRYFQNQMQWPIDLEWTNMMGNWPEFPSAVGSIDSTPHEIYRPLTEPQILFYSGHRHYHCFNTLLIIDNQGHLRYVHAGFMGSMHDATSYRRMPQIGPGLPLSLPHGAHFLANRAYPDGVSLLTAVRAQQMPKDMKTYKCIGSIWRLMDG